MYPHRHWPRAGTFALVLITLGIALNRITAQPETYVVYTTADSGPGSLREAITFANANPGTLIRFEIPAPLLTGGVAFIQPLSPLPPVTAGNTVIDGTTQTAFTGDTNPKGPEVVLNGGRAGAGANGLVLQGVNSEVRGLVVNGFSGMGILIAGPGASGNRIEGCYIGTDASGEAAEGNEIGVKVESPNNVIGGSTAGSGNVISGNRQSGLLIQGTAATGNQVLGNRIGTNASGSAPVPNQQHGVLIESSGGNAIGSGTPETRNVISGNAQLGVRIEGAAASGNRVQGNFIGTNAIGMAPIPNGAGGICVDGAPSTVIGGAGTGNVVSGNGGDGVVILGAGASGNQVLGNRIGTDAAGNVRIANASNGVSIQSAPNTIIGGPDGAGNLISGNGAYGVLIGASTTGTQITGNQIGTNADGTAALPNAGSGVGIVGATGNSVGVPGGVRNVISGNVYWGVFLSGTAATANQVVGNYIGTNSAGTGPLGNQAGGVWLDNAPNNVVGAPGAGNLISGNHGAGVVLSGAAATGNKVCANLIGTNYDGTGAVPNATDGIVLEGASGNRIGDVATGSGNVISGNGRMGIDLFAGATGNQVQGNLIGLNATGTEALPNAGDGVLITDSPANVIGGTDPTSRNVISGNNQNGIEILGKAASGNQVLGNFIGTSVSGSAAVPNKQFGICIDQAPDNVIGGTAAGAGNVISGNLSHGVLIVTKTAVRNLVQGNLIGTDATGQVALPNAQCGVLVDGAPDNLVGGTAAGAGNVISGNADCGVLIANAGATGNRVEGNLIGTNRDGTSALPNRVGVGIRDAGNNAIGGTATNAGNVVAGNSEDGVRISGETASHNVVYGNLIGTDISGNRALGNAWNGVLIHGAPNNAIGISGLGRNVISGNGGNGVTLKGDKATGNTVQGNRIGVALDGSALPNGQNGVLLDGCPSNVIGGPNAPDGNIIAYHPYNGVQVLGEAVGNWIVGNSIHHNARLGIDLVGGAEDSMGITPNDPDDLDTGPNDLQNHPVIRQAVSGTARGVQYTEVVGVLHSQPYQTYQIGCYSSPAPEGTMVAQGETYLGSMEVQTDGNGRAAFRFTITGSSFEAPPVPERSARQPAHSAPEQVGVIHAAPVLVGKVVTLTASHISGSTSEFSPPTAVKAALDGTLSVTGSTDATLLANALVVPGTGLLNMSARWLQGPLTTAQGAISAGTYTTTGVKLFGIASGILLSTGDVRTYTDGPSLSTGTSTNFEAEGYAPLNALAGRTTYDATVLRVEFDTSSTTNSVRLQFVFGSEEFPEYVGSGYNDVLGIFLNGNNIAFDQNGEIITINTAFFDVGTDTELDGNTALVTLRAPVVPGSHNTLDIAIADAGDHSLDSTVYVARLVGSPDILSGSSTSPVIRVRNTADSGPESLREAILVANQQPGSTIAFAIPTTDPGFSNGVFTIRPNSPLPPIEADGTTIDGSTQTDFTGNTNPLGPEIVLDGSQAGPEADGLVLTASGATVQNLEIHSFSGVGIRVVARSVVARSPRAPSGSPNGFMPMRNRLSNNHIHDNGRLGIDLVGGNEDSNGVTANDPGDTDDGPNGLLNFPTLTSILCRPSRTTINGILETPNPEQCWVQLFANDAPDPSGYGEGQSVIEVPGGAIKPQPDGTFTITVPKNLVGKHITALAIDAQGNTSEFSRAVRADVTHQPDLLVKNAGEDDTSYAGNDRFFATPSPEQTKTQPIGLGIATYHVRIDNESVEPYPFLLKATESPEEGWRVVYTVNGVDVSQAVRSTGYLLPPLAPEASAVMTVAISRVDRAAPVDSSKTVTLSAYLGLEDPTPRDVVQMVAVMEPVNQPDLLIRTATEPDSAYAIPGVFQETPSGDQVEVQTGATGVASVFQILLRNVGNSTRAFVLKAWETAESGWIVVYRLGTNDVSAALRSATGYTTPELAPGAEVVFTVEMTPDASVIGQTSKSVLLQAFLDGADTMVRDSVLARTYLGVLPRVDLMVKNASEPDTAYAVRGTYRAEPSEEQTRRQTVYPNATALYHVKVENAGTSARSFVLKAAESGADGWTVVYRAGERDVSESIRTSGYQTATLAPGASEILRVEVTPSSGAASGSTRRVLIQALLEPQDVVRDVVQMVTTVEGTTVEGTVMLPSGVALPADAVVELRDADDHVVTTTRVAPDGKFLISGPPGTYDLVFRASGYIPIRQRSLPLTEQRTVLTGAKILLLPQPDFGSGLRLVTFPFSFRNGAVERVVGDANAVLFSYNGSAGRYITSGTEGFPEVRPGRGFWMKQRRADRGAPYRIEEPADQPALDRPIEIPLSLGWQLIGNPFPSGPVNLDQIKVILSEGAAPLPFGDPAVGGAVRGYLWGWTGQGYELVAPSSLAQGTTSYLATYRGYWIRCTVEGARLVIEPPSGGRAEPLPEGRKRRPEGGWHVRLVARVGNYTDADNYLGVGRTAYTVEGPPQMEGYVDVRFLLPDGTRAAVDIRERQAVRTTWNFEVATDQEGEEVTLTWPDLSQVPRNVRLVLVDEATGQRRQMRTSAGLRFTAGADPRRFRIEAEPAVGPLLAITGIEVAPVRGTGRSIAYTLSSGATTTVDVLSPSGRRIRRVAQNTAASAGRNQVYWDGRDANGVPISAGLVLVQVTATNDEGASVRAVRPVVLTR